MFYIPTPLLVICSVLILLTAPAKAAEIQFVTQAVTIAEAGVPYQYDARAMSNATATITYELDEAPVGMVCNAVTGSILWATPTEGDHNVVVKAVATAGLFGKAEALQEYTLRVVLSRDSAHVQCVLLRGDVVLRTAGSVITDGMIHAWRIGGGFYATAIVKGSFAMSVPKGTYILRASASGEAEFKTTFYATDSIASLTARTADRLTIDCNDTINITFPVNPVDDAGPTVITGIAVDAETSAGLTADVTFTRVGLGFLGTARMTVRTESDGSFSIELPHGRYTAVARARAELNGDVAYHTQFFEQETDATCARVFATTEINGSMSFRLQRLPTPDSIGSIRGRLLASVASSVTGTISAYRIDSTGQMSLDAAVSTITDAEGRFELQDLPIGEYILCTRPDSDSVLGGYVVIGAHATAVWQHASRIRVDMESTTNIDVRLRPTAVVRGFATITGRVLADIAGTVDIAVKGALVTCTNVYGEVVATTFTDLDGRFELAALSSGEYLICVDRIGLQAVTRTVVISETQTNPETSFIMSRVTSVHETESIPLQVMISPNPATTQALITLDAVPGDLEISIYNMVGSLITRSSRPIASSGRVSILIPIVIEHGFYYVQLKNGGRVGTHPLVVQR